MTPWLEVAGAGFVFVFFLLPLATVVHETGHALTARLSGVPVRAIEIGRGRRSVTIKIPSLPPIVLRSAFFRGGRTLLGQLPTRGRKAFILLGGVAANLVVGLPLVAFYRSGPPALFFCGFFFGLINVLEGVLNLIPMPPSPPRHGGSDGWRLQRLVFHPREYNDAVEADRRLSEAYGLLIRDRKVVHGEAAKEGLAIAGAYFRRLPPSTWQRLDANERLRQELVIALALRSNGEDITSALDRVGEVLRRSARTSVSGLVMLIGFLAVSSRAADHEEAIRRAREAMTENLAAQRLSDAHRGWLAGILAWLPMTSEHPDEASIATAEKLALDAKELSVPEMRVSNQDILALVRIRQGRLPEAEELVRQSLSVAESPADEAHKRTVLALALVKQDRYEEAASLVKDLIAKSAWIPLLPEVLRALPDDMPNRGAFASSPSQINNVDA
jgi:hypothetical protein